MRGLSLREPVLRAYGKAFAMLDVAGMAVPIVGVFNDTFL